MLRKRLIRHELRHQQPLISLAATPDQIRQPLAPQAPDGSRLLEELAIVGPGEAVEALDGDRAAGVELALVDDVGGLEAVLGDDVVGGEPPGGGLQLVEAVLGEAGPRALLPVPVLKIGGFKNGRLEVGVEPAEREFGAASSHRQKQSEEEREREREGERGKGRSSGRGGQTIRRSALPLRGGTTGG